MFGWGEGESKIPLFFEIINVLSLFEKYLTMYYFFEIQVWHETRVYENRVSWKSSIETFFFFLGETIHLELEFIELEFFMIYNLE